MILGIDVRDWEKPTHKLVSTTREVTSYVPEDCVWMEIGFAELEMSAWAFDYGRYQPKKHVALETLGSRCPSWLRLLRPSLTETRDWSAHVTIV